MSFKIYGENIEPGTRSFLQMKIARMLDGGDLCVPLHVIRGEGDGSVLGLVSSNHGAEYYHNRTVRRIVNETDPSEVKGTILVIPVANPLAFSHKTRLSPNPPEETVDFANLNRVFPGRRVTPLFGSLEPTDISLTMKMAATITENFVRRCNYIMDFHGHGRGGALKKMLYNGVNGAAELAHVFGLGIIHDPITASGGEWRGAYMPMTSYSGSIGIPGVAPEIGGASHSEPFEKECERLGVQGVRNVMAHLKMTEDEIVLPEKQFYFRRAPHVRATNGGYLVSNMVPEDVGIGRPTREVSKGEVLGTVYDPYTLEELEQLKAPVDGLLYMCQISGLIEAQGGGIAVADFEDSKWIE
jgi:predicted deacylase